MSRAYLRVPASLSAPALQRTRQVGPLQRPHRRGAQTAGCDNLEAERLRPPKEALPSEAQVAAVAVAAATG